MVLAQGVHKRFGAVDVLRGIALEVGRGEVVCLLGPSGSGKSTSLRCINHLEQINSGRIYVDGTLVGYKEKDSRLYELHDKDACHHRAEIGMVFQRFNLFPHMTALENVALAPVAVKGQPRAEAQARAPFSPKSDLGTSRRRIQMNSPAANSSASPSHGPLP
jgi:polar amino acid transport system ATP-binding protein